MLFVQLAAEPVEGLNRSSWSHLATEFQTARTRSNIAEDSARSLRSRAAHLLAACPQICPQSPFSLSQKHLFAGIKRVPLPGFEPDCREAPPRNSRDKPVHIPVHMLPPNARVTSVQAGSHVSTRGIIIRVSGVRVPPPASGSPWKLLVFPTFGAGWHGRMCPRYVPVPEPVTTAPAPCWLVDAGSTQLAAAAGSIEGTQKRNDLNVPGAAARASSARDVNAIAPSTSSVRSHAWRSGSRPRPS